MTEVPSSSDLVWRSGMNRDLVGRVAGVAIDPSANYSRSAEPSYGQRAPVEAEPLTDAQEAEAADIVDDVFAQIRPQMDQA